MYFATAAFLQMLPTLILAGGWYDTCTKQLINFSNDWIHYAYIDASCTTAGGSQTTVSFYVECIVNFDGHLYWQKS
ncbi:hypothetical protein B0J14DRAFT_696964 [Halenospora varia]|nr:hypothetical protein B0J14DRAFT_696964 [Halenospora varia]